MQTIFLPNFMQPSSQSLDLGITQTFTAKVNGYMITDYQLIIKSLDNIVQYDSSKKTLTTPLYGTQTLEMVISAGSVSYRGQLKWILTYWNGTETVSSTETIFTNMSTPVITGNVLSTLTSRSLVVNYTYTQAESIPVKQWQINLYDYNNVLLQSSGEVYSPLITYEINKMANNSNYYTSITVETQSPTGEGIIINQIKAFNVLFPLLTIDFSPKLTQLGDKSGVKVDWSLLAQNEGTITGTSAYISKYLKDDNIGLSLDANSSIKYADFITPEAFTTTFMQQLDKDFNGIFYTTDNGDYQVGYSNINATIGDGAILPGENGGVVFVGNWATELPNEYHVWETRRSDVANDTATLPYSGTGISVNLIQSENSGIVEVLIDGVSLGTIDLYKAKSDVSIVTGVLSASNNIIAYQNWADSKTLNDLSTKTINDISTLNLENLIYKYIKVNVTNFNYANHNLVLKNTGTKNASSKATSVNLKGLTVLNGLYDNKFYSIIQGNIKYSQRILITDNPFIITLLPTSIKIKQYNVYELLENLENYSLNDLSKFSLDFVGQTNN